jgi:Ni2+-binding GTPase involved in maturation of urease and hydrogenase
MAAIRMILVGGFLGAGKTTLIAQAAEHFVSQGQRVGLITNDQAPNLADTGLLQQAGFGVDEVSGGCFCCHFDDLVKAWDRVIERQDPQVIIGEPVGSCTDVSATVFQPIKKDFADKFDLAPLSVLCDPRRLAEALDPEISSSLPGNVLYIYLKQLEEADLIVINKVDLISPDDQVTLRAALGMRFPETPVLSMSALRGDGVESWLAELDRLGPGGGRISEVDYDIYAQGEAALGWLNASVALSAGDDHQWQPFAARLMEALVEGCRERQAEVAHMKIHLTAGQGSLSANLTSCRDEPRLQVRGEPRGAEAHLVVNARCPLDPEDLKQMVIQGLEASAGGGVSYQVTTLESFRPARPEPTHRYSEVV